MSIDIQKQLETILNEVSQKQFEAVQGALKETAEEVVTIMERNSPIGGSANGFKGQWKAQTYAGNSYIGNEKLTKNGIPLINILEGKDQTVSKIWDRNRTQIQTKLIRSIESKIK